MAVYQAGFSVVGVNTANSTYVNLKTSATQRARIREVGIFISSASTNAPDFVLSRMNAVGTGTITTATVAQADTGDAAAATTLETAWTTTRPTLVTGAYFRRLLLPVTAGGGIVWVFPDDLALKVPVSAGIVLANINASGATTGTFTGYFVWEE